MVEYIMRFDKDDSGKLINARRVGKIVRCMNCERVEFDELFSDFWCDGRVVKPNGFCEKGIRQEDSDKCTE